MKGGHKLKATGIIRKVDELGRIVIPIELRRTLNIKEKDPMEIYVSDDRIILKKYVAEKVCYLSGELSEDNLTFANGKLTLSEESAKQLLEELKNSLDDEK